MAKCKYLLKLDGDQFKFNSERELNDFVLLNKIPGKNAIKFSKDLNKLNLTYKALKDLSDLSKKDDFRNKEILWASEFLSTTHDFGKGEMLLAPVFDPENYAVNLAETEGLTGEELETRKQEILKELEEQDLRDISEFWGKIVKDSVINKNNTEYFSTGKDIELIEEFIKKVETYNKTKYSLEEKTKIKTNLKNQVSNFIDSVVGSNVKFVNLRISNPIGKVKDIIDLVSINDSGIPNIVKFSLSRKPFVNWDSAKKSQFDHRLGLQRQLLEQSVSTKKSALYLVPFHLPSIDGKLDLLNFSTERHQQRQFEKWLSPSETSENSITYKMRKLIPGRSTDFHIEEGKADLLNKQLLGALLGSNYIISSKRQLQNKEALIKKIVDKKESNKADHYILWDQLNNKKIQIDTLEELDKQVEKYIQRYNEDKNSKVYEFRSKLKEALENNERSITFGKYSILNTNFNKYLDGDWELIENDVFLNQDLIVLRNNHYKTVEVISITSNSISNVYNLGLGRTLLGKFKSDLEAGKDNNILQANTVNVESIKVLSVLNNSPELFEGYNLGGIKVINYLENKGGETNLEQLIYNFRKLFTTANVKNELESVDNFGSKKIKLQNRADYYYSEIIDKMSTSSYSELRDISKARYDDPPKDKLQWLFEMQEKLVDLDQKIQAKPETFFEYGDKNSIGFLQQLVAFGIAYYSGIQFKDDYEQPRIGTRVGDITDIFRAVITGSSDTYDKEGNKIVGFLGGSLFTTASSNPSEDINKILDFISMGHSQIRQLFVPFANMSTKWTDDYYKDCGRSGLEKTLIGNADPFHEVFFVKNKQTGKIDDSFTALNPYDMSVNLKDHERKYLKKILWEFYKDNGKVLEKYKSLSIEDAEKLPEFETYIKDTKYFEIPLKKRSDIKDLKILTGLDVRKTVGRAWEQFKDVLDNRNLTDIQRKDFERQERAAFKMTNEFRISDDTRAKILNEYGVQSFEINLDTLLLEQRFSFIRENVMNRVLQIANALAVCLKFHAYSTGRVEETMKAFEDFYKQIRVSVYGANVMDKEMQPLVAGIKHIQNLASIMFITLRPLLMVKELLAGTWKNYSYAYTKIWGDESFEIEHMKKAYNKVFFGALQMGKDFDLVRNFNALYGIANQDINVIAKRMKVDRKGLFQFSSRHLFWLNGAGDFVNRLSVFVAMTMKDGSYDAHYIDSNGVFKYDPRKDKRFDKYFAKREQYDFKFAKNDKEYNDQRSLYLAMLADFNVENSTIGLPELNEKKDLIPRAYTHKQRESIKVFADTAYGFFDTETKSMIFHTAVGSIFGQFLTFLPSKIEFYFSKEKMSKYGKYVQRKGLDENGEEKPYWLKDIFDENNNYLGTEETFENTGVPSRSFMTDPWEGVMYSLGHVVRDIIKGNYSETPEARKRRAMIAMNDLIMGMIAASIVAALLSEFKQRDDADEASNLALKTLYKTTTEFGPMMLFTSTRWEPAFWSVLTNFKNIFTSIFDDKSNTEKMIRNTFKAAELLPTITY